VCRIETFKGGPSVTWDRESVDADTLAFVVQIDRISGEGERMNVSSKASTWRDESVMQPK
jgi:hypothetical protein